MKIYSGSGRRTAATVALALVALVLPFSQPAFAESSPTIQVTATHTSDPKGDHFFVNQDDQVVLTATLSGPAPHDVNIDWENEGGPNDPGPDRDPTAGSSDRTAPDRTCTIPPGALSCSIDYIAEETGYDRTIENPSPRGAGSSGGGDQWRAWVDQDHPGAVVNSNLTDDSDSAEGPDEDQQPGNQEQNAAGNECVAEGSQEPDCTDVVVVNIGALEVAPDIQTVDAGSTAILIARMFAPVQGPAGLNIDWEAENNSNGTPSTNDPDQRTSRQTPDFSCDIPQGQRECTNAYAMVGGADNWRVWIDEDRVQSSDDSDTSEGRYAGLSDCDQPEDPSNCQVTNFFGDAPSPGDGCDFSGATGEEGDPSEPDCTDVVRVESRAGTVARIDCDDRSGAQSQDTERETNPESSVDPVTRADPSVEPYKCEAFNASGGRMNGIVIKGEVENGVNDPDSPDSASYGSPDYQCTTAADPRAPVTALSRDNGICYMDVRQVEGELGTAEICFWTGTATEGQALCADEPTGEAQLANNTDPANDLADQVEKTWADPATFILDCEPETDANPAGQTHQITCTATSRDGATVGGAIVHTEMSGAGDPDGGAPNFRPDASCTTEGNGSCTIPHTSSSEGTTEYRSWIDDPDTEPDPTEEGAEDADLDEGRNEQIDPGDKPEPDNTDVTEKLWTPPGANLTMTPDSDTAAVGECNPYTITLTDDEGNPVPNAIIDVEQRHERASNQTANDEPTVGFCEPPASGGPNPSNVDESRGDLGAGEGGENPDNPGTAGGETQQGTDQNGRITIGIRVAPGNGSNGSGGVSITAWWETDNDDDPEAGEPQDTSTKSWTPSQGEPGVPAGANLSPAGSTDEPGEVVTYTVTISDANGDPVEGTAVTWAEEGTGEFVNQESTTDASGQATAQVTSQEEGTQTISVSADECAEGATCADSSTQTWKIAAPETCPGFADDPRNQIVGTPGNDVLRGTEGDDIICGLAGKDTLIGRGGDDLLLGGNGNDILRGNAGADTLRGGKGEDTLQGGGGADVLKGQADDDILRGGGGNDTLRGNRGKDILRGRGGNDRLFGNKGHDSLNGGRGNDLLNGGPGRDSCVGGSGRDRFRNCE